MTSPALDLDTDSLVPDPLTRIVVCCGSGGVGKTTTSAALALRAAERGAGRRAHDRPGPPAGAVARPRALDNTPRPVAGVDGGPAALSTR